MVHVLWHHVSMSESKSMSFAHTHRGGQAFSWGGGDRAPWLDPPPPKGLN